MEKERYRLYRFAQSHLISQDSVPILVPVFDKPVEAFQLEVFEHSMVLIDGDILAPVLFGFFLGPSIEQI